jgi:hypothetical protein
VSGDKKQQQQQQQQQQVAAAAEAGGGSSSSSNSSSSCSWQQQQVASAAAAAMSEENLWLWVWGLLPLLTLLFFTSTRVNFLIKERFLDKTLETANKVPVFFVAWIGPIC